MPQLREIQQAFADAMINGNHQAVTGAIVPKESALRNVALYRRLIRTNYTQVLAVTYPVLCRLVGPRYFDILARGYLKKYPSTGGDLFPYGRHLPAFLNELQVSSLLVELARLEWACHEVYQAADSPPLSTDRLQAMVSVDPSRVTVQFHPTARFLSFPIPVHQVWLALQPHSSSDDLVDLPLPDEQTGVVVTRNDGKVQVTPLAWLDYRLVEALSHGADVASIEQMALEFEPEFDFARLMTTLLSLHVIAGCSLKEGV